MGARRWGNVKVTLVSESFLPHVNGVSNSVCRVLEHLQRRGHDASLLTPTAGSAGVTPRSYADAPVHVVPSVPLPGYAQVRVAVAGRRLVGAHLDDERPDVVYLASPFVLGLAAARAAEARRIPTVASYQTDVAGFAQRYHAGAARAVAWQRVRAIHRRAALTLAPSGPALRALAAQGIPRLTLWQRGVDGERFHPRHRDEAWRRRLAPGGEVLVGYLGRLAPEKQLGDLAALAGLPGVQLVLIGDGPERSRLAQLLPGAVFLGFLEGAALSRAVASLDVMVHPGEHETFCQSAQEGLASGVPVVAVAAGGLVDLVQPGRTGYLYPPGDLAQLRLLVSALADQAGHRDQLAAAARASVVGRTWERLGDDLLRHLEHVRDRTRPRGV
jgi:phosphatidylinositol alpha 1,6-mannosyltransferase